MSGAAGALVPLAPANRLLGIMSALTLLSVIAPSAPSVPKGPSGEVASGFQDLLTAVAGEDVAGPGAKHAVAETGTPDDTKADGTDNAGFLAAPTPPPVPLVLPAAEETPADSDSKASADEGGETRPTTLPPAPAVTSGPADDPPTTPLLPVDKSPPAKTNDPQVQPGLVDTRYFRDQMIAERATRAAAAATPAAEARTAAPAPAPAPTSVPVPVSAAPAPPPLRPLADRTARPVDAATVTTGDAPRAAGPVQTAASPVAPTAVTDQPARPAEFIAAATRNAAEGAEAEAPASEFSTSGEGASAQTQAPAAARETGVSQLSRATIEATAQIAAQILRRLEGRSTRFEMALTPDELGRVDVKLDIDSEGRLNARLAFDNPAAATDLRGRADELRRQLEDAGFHLAEDAFEFADRDSGSNAFDRGQDARNSSSRAFAAASRLNTETDVAQPPRWLALTLSPSGVDMKV